jgi:hypothetical protein
MKKAKIFLSFVTLLVIILALFLTLQFSVAQTSSVGGQITTNTTWSQANSPYTLTANIYVNSGVTLTIEAGSTVNLADHAIRVSGTLNARGTTSNKIALNATTPTLWSSEGVIVFLNTSSPWNEQAQTGCIIENAVITANQPVSTIYIDSASPKINLCSIVNSGIGNDVTHGGIYIGYEPSSVPASPIITNNVIGNSDGINDNSESGANIVGNYFYDCPTAVYTRGSSNITNNLIVNNRNGVVIGLENGPAIGNIQNNMIAQNQYGVTINSYFSQNNTVIANLNYNNFDSNINNMYIFGTTSVPETVNAANNWWGTTGMQAINLTIYYNPFPFSGIVGISVNFSPWLSAPNPSAPSLDYNPITNPSLTTSPTSSPSPTVVPTATATPTPTSTTNANPQYTAQTSSPSNVTAPEFPSVIAVVVVLFVVTLATLVLAKKQKK